jgi:dTDP-4-amino-4,6-dideoxygalactose transaminase
VWHLYVVRHALRDRLRAALADAGIGTGLHYPEPLHLQRAYAAMGHGPGSFPESEAWAREGLSLPMFPGLDDERIDRVVDVLRAHERP